jgi:hypothetical protein
VQLGSAALTLPYVREGQFPDTSDPPAMLSATASQVQPAASALATTVVGELVDPGGLAACAAEIAVRQRSPETRRTYPAV